MKTDATIGKPELHVPDLIRERDTLRADLRELRAQIAEEVDQFNAGFEAAEKNADSMTAEITYFQTHPDETNHDEFMIGFAWASWTSRKESTARADADRCRAELDALRGLVRAYISRKDATGFPMPGREYRGLAAAEAALRAAVQEEEKP